MMAHIGYHVSGTMLCQALPRRDAGAESGTGQGTHPRVNASSRAFAAIFSPKLRETSCMVGTLVVRATKEQLRNPQPSCDQENDFLDGNSVEHRHASRGQLATPARSGGKKRAGGRKS